MEGVLIIIMIIKEGVWIIITIMEGVWIIITIMEGVLIIIIAKVVIKFKNSLELLESDRCTLSVY